MSTFRGHPSRKTLLPLKQALGESHSKLPSLPPALAARGLKTRGGGGGGEELAQRWAFRHNRQQHQTKPIRWSKYGCNTSASGGCTRKTQTRVQAVPLPLRPPSPGRRASTTIEAALSSGRELMLPWGPVTSPARKLPSARRKETLCSSPTRCPWSPSAA